MAFEKPKNLCASADVVAMSWRCKDDVVAMSR